MDPHTGGCLCRQVRYTVEAEPIGAGTCWCRDCQYIACGSGNNSVLFPESSVQFAGGVTRMERIADRGNRLERGFCPKCGSHLYSRTLEPTGMPIRIRVGTLENPEIAPPTAAIWVSSAPNWAAIHPSMPCHERGLDSPLMDRGD